MSVIFSMIFVDIIAGLLFLFAIFKLARTFRQRAYTTPLLGPPSTSFLFGITKDLFLASDPSVLHVRWAEQYGPAFRVPRGLGKNAIILVDPRACAHFHSKETYVYISTPFRRKIMKRIFGEGLLLAEGESHKRQRRALNQAFTNSALRNLTCIFYDYAYKVKDKWDNTILNTASSAATIDIQQWANMISLDNIGLAGFSYEFSALEGRQSAIFSVFESASSKEVGWMSKAVTFLAIFFPSLSYLPTRQNRLLSEVRTEAQQIGYSLLNKNQEEKDNHDEMAQEKSALGLLLKSEREVSDATRHSRGEVISQINTLIFAGYETTSITMTWSLIEMCKRPHIQETLRQELLAKYATSDPTWDDLCYDLQYLDAVCLETLRLHPPLIEVSRMAGEDDIIPLSQPVKTTTGNTVTSISIAKGTYVRSAIGALNRDKSIWGSDADEFKPDRWLDLEKSESRVKEIQGHKHIMTFGDGQRICLGRNFALAEWKVTLAVLLRNFTFELPDGPDTAIELHSGFLKRPKIAGCIGAEMLMKVKKFDG